MPRRYVPFINGHYYHIFNKGISSIKTFNKTKFNQRFLDLISYYRFDTHNKRFSYFDKLGFIDKQEYLSEIQTPNNALVKIHTFSLMPNHYHFLLEQIQDKGIQTFMSKLINSYTKYFNTIEGRSGQLFLTQFKSKLITEEEIFLHVCRYIMLNPLTSGIVQSFEELTTYPYTSLVDYLKSPREFIFTETIKHYFKDQKSFKKFISDQAGYQRELKTLKEFMV